jgi:uridine phosphorylase
LIKLLSKLQKVTTKPDDVRLQGMSDKNKAYHLDASGAELANLIIIVGDPDRLALMQPLFDSIEVTGGKREIKFFTGNVHNKRVSVISSGMGTDNIDILFNEIALLCEGRWNQLKILRIGTTGAVRPDIEPGTKIISRYALGLDGMLNHYKAHKHTEDENAFIDNFIQATQWPKTLARPYLTKATLELPKIPGAVEGITMTTNGFYAPQIRHLHLETTVGPEFFENILNLEYAGYRINNFEMEMAGIFGLSALFGFKCAGICVVLANRSTHSSVLDSKELVNELIETGIKALTLP